MTMRWDDDNWTPACHRDNECAEIVTTHCCQAQVQVQTKFQEFQVWTETDTHYGQQCPSTKIWYFEFWAWIYKCIVPRHYCIKTKLKLDPIDCKCCPCISSASGGVTSVVSWHKHNTIIWISHLHNCEYSNALFIFLTQSHLTDLCLVSCVIWPLLRVMSDKLTTVWCLMMPPGGQLSTLSLFTGNVRW